MQEYMGGGAQQQLPSRACLLRRPHIFAHMLRFSKIISVIFVSARLSAYVVIQQDKEHVGV